MLPLTSIQLIHNRGHILKFGNQNKKTSTQQKIFPPPLGSLPCSVTLTLADHRSGGSVHQHHAAGREEPCSLFDCHPTAKAQSTTEGVGSPPVLQRGLELDTVFLSAAFVPLLWMTPIYCYFIVVHVQLSAFSPHHSPPPQPSPPPSPDSTPRLSFVHVSFIVVPENPFPLFPPLSSYLPSGYCQIILNFNVSGYILLACLFC